MDDIKSALSQFEKLLKDTNSPILAKFNPGIGQALQKQLFSASNFLPPDVMELYKWRNGTKNLPEDNLGQRWFFNYGMLISLEEALEVHSSLANQIEKWDLNKFPLFISGAGDFYLLECDQAASTFGMIYYHSLSNIDFDVLITKYDSLLAFFKSVSQCYKEAAYSFDSEGYFDVDDSLERRICSRLNPKSHYWDIHK